MGNFEQPKEYVLRACILLFFVLLTGHIECAIFVFGFNLWFAYLAYKKQQEVLRKREEQIRMARIRKEQEERERQVRYKRAREEAEKNQEARRREIELALKDVFGGKNNVYN